MSVYLCVVIPILLYVPFLIIRFDFNTCNKPYSLQTPLTIKEGWSSLYGIVLQIQNYIIETLMVRAKKINFYRFASFCCRTDRVRRVCPAGMSPTTNQRGGK